MYCVVLLKEITHTHISYKHVLILCRRLVCTSVVLIITHVTRGKISEVESPQLQWGLCSIVVITVVLWIWICTEQIFLHKRIINGWWKGLMWKHSVCVSFMFVFFFLYYKIILLNLCKSSKMLEHILSTNEISVVFD